MKSKAALANSNTNVTINEGKLILSLPDAKSPTIWQTDIASAQLSAFSIQEDAKEKTFALISKCKNPEDEAEITNEIAVFDDKQNAVDILMEISNAMQETAHSGKKSSPSNDNKAGNNDNKVGAIISVALILVLIIIWTQSSSNRGGSGEQRSGSANLPSSSARESSGVPMSADDFLSNR